MGIVSLISGVGLLTEAEAILAGLPAERYLGAALWCLQHALASVRVRMGHFEEAGRTLDGCKGNSPSAAYEEEHRYLRGLVNIATGHASRARKRVKDTDKPEHREQLLAHVAAAEGDDEQASVHLERVRKLQYGPTMLKMIANGHLPARHLALRLVGREPPTD